MADGNLGLVLTENDTADNFILLYSIRYRNYNLLERSALGFNFPLTDKRKKKVV